MNGMMDAVKTADREPSQDHTSVCSLCLVQFAKYTCPRCNVQYCSLDCYKSEKHAQCSECFYRESFMSELQSRTTSGAERARMMEMLRRVEEESVREDAGLEEGEEEGDSQSLEERLAGLDLDSEDADSVWQRLTESEQKQFQRAVASGHLGSLLPLHAPWWELVKPVVVINERTGADPNDPTPNLLVDLPLLHTLVKGGKTSPMVCYNVLNVLYAYAYAVRLYNGEHLHLAVEASQTVLDISCCLSENASFSVAGEAITHAVTMAQQNRHLFSSAEMAFSVMRDVSLILCSRPPCSCCRATHALSDLHRMLTTAAAQLHQQKGPECKKQYRAVFLASKKVYFLTVWASENTEDLQRVARVVDIEHETSVARWRAHSQDHNPSSRRRRGKLIQEMS